MTANTLLVGFDSAWTPTNAGALVGALCIHDGTFRSVAAPQVVDFPEAQRVILGWQAEYKVGGTLVLLDQPTIVPNATGQRPVENLVGSPVSLRHGGMQPANTSRAEMFGEGAPVWPFLARFGGPANPYGRVIETLVIETYPVLAMIALNWMLKDPRPAGRLPKYNPERRKTFSIADWRHVCELASGAFRERGLTKIVDWIDEAGRKSLPRKGDQDGVDACLCLLVAAYLAERQACLMVGNLNTGYIVVPHAASLTAELEARCNQTGRVPSEWVRVFRLSDNPR